MSITLPQAIIDMKGGDFKRIILIRIIPNDGDGWPEFDWATGDVTILNWDGNSKNFEGGVLLEGGLGTISHSVDIEQGGNVATLGNLTFSVINPEYDQGMRFDNYLRSHDIELSNRMVEIYLGFYEEAEPLTIDYADLLLLYTGKIDDKKYDYEKVEITISSVRDIRHKEIPDLVINFESYPYAVETNTGKVAPLLYGEICGGSLALSDFNASPFVNIDKAKMQFIISRNAIFELSNLYIYQYDGSNNRWIQLLHGPDTPDWIPYLTVGRPATVQLINDLFPEVGVYGMIYSQATEKSDKTTTTSSDTSKVVDKSDDTYCQITGVSKLLFKIPIPISSALITSEAANQLVLKIQVLSSTGTNPIGKILYWNPDFDNGAGGWATGQEINANPDPEILSWDFGTDKSAHGRMDDQGDQNEHWRLDEIGVCHWGISLYSGRTMNIANIWIEIDRVKLNLLNPLYTGPIFINSRGERIPLGSRIEPFNSISLDSIGGDIKGAYFGNWIAEDLRTNGYNSGNLVQYGAYIIETILRDELGLTSSEINFASFDSVGNTTNGTRKDWKFAGIINRKTSSLNVISALCRQGAMIYFTDYQNKEKVIPLKAGIPIKTIDRTTIKEKEIGPIDNTKLENVYNEFYVNYDKSWMANNFRKTIYLTASTHNLTDNDRDGAPSTFTLLCAESQIKYGMTRRLTLDCDWINDAVTAEKLIKWLAEWFCYRHPIVNFESAGLDHLDLELGDLIAFDHTLVPK